MKRILNFSCISLLLEIDSKISKSTHAGNLTINLSLLNERACASVEEETALITSALLIVYFAIFINNCL